LTVTGLLSVLALAHRPHPVDRAGVAVATASAGRSGAVGLTVGVQIAERVVVLGRARAVVAGRHPLVSSTGAVQMRYMDEWRAYPLPRVQTGGLRRINPLTCGLSGAP